MMSATGKEHWKTLFEPKVPGFVHVPFNDIEAIKAKITENTIAVMIEPVQGEGGAVPADEAYLKALRELCTQQNIVLIVDEIQTGLGRTGSLFAYEHAGIEPDIMTLAKGIGGGFPLAAMLAKNKFCVFEAGDHGGTYGGNPLAMAVGLAVVNEIVSKDLTARALRMGEYLKTKLAGIDQKYGITNIRGKGLLIGLDLPKECGTAVVKTALDNGLIINSPRPAALRFIPPLIVEEKHIDEMIELLEDSLAAVMV